ncbi:MAG: hypothetical protein Q8Q08_08860 [Candidatus Omnitrophota bacterium]|nr:hypothetical protein [Candidatus Omnitrophota bacterium]MDZ4242651.1 hypothetical protein [Candidatus Omnitrophota bacterium]
MQLDQTVRRCVAVMSRGYGTNPAGALIGTTRGFVDAFIGGYVLAWLYNRLSKLS